MSGKRVAALLTLLAALLLPATGTATAAGPAVQLSDSTAAKGSSLTATGTGWPAHTLVMLLVCGQSSPARGVLGGTDSCANADGRAVTTDADGRFSTALPAAAPPVPCPCVVHVATATGTARQADAALDITGHPVKPLPATTGTGTLKALAPAQLKGSSGVLTWFGAPASRTFVVTVGNSGTSAVTDPVFQVGTAHGVFAPEWDDHQWKGTLAPGQKARLELPVELSTGAHGQYTVSLRYGTAQLAQQAWPVGRPWGVALFWLLAAVVIPSAVFRVGMAVVEKVRRTETPPAPTPTKTLPLPLPWFTPDTQGRLSAPHDDHPTAGRKGTP